MSGQQPPSFQPIIPKPVTAIIPIEDELQGDDASATTATVAPSIVKTAKANSHSCSTATTIDEEDDNRIGKGTPLQTLAELSTTTTTTTTTTTRTGRSAFSFSGKTYEVGNLIPERPSEDCNFAKRYQCLIKKRDTAWEDNTLIQCSVCKRGLTHVSCYINFVNADKNGHLQKDSNSGKLSVTCSKACYNRVAMREKLKQDKINRMSDKRRCIPWDRDAMTDGGPTSMSVLLDWITTKPNYARFNRGTRNSLTGKTKYAISMEVVTAITNAGIITPRTQEAVIAKISQLETDYDEAHDWFTGAGAGITNESTIKAAILMRCKYYYDLYDVMQDRALSNNAYTAASTSEKNCTSHHCHTSPSAMSSTKQSEKSCPSQHCHNPPSPISNTQQRYGSMCKNTVDLDSFSDIGIKQGGDDRSDSDDGTRNTAINQTISESDGITDVELKQDISSEMNLFRKKENGLNMALCILNKKMDSAVTTFGCHKMNDSSHSVMSEYLKANTAMQYEGMKEKVAIRRLEERKLKREMRITREDHEMHELKKQRMQMELAMELARNRTKLRENGVSEREISILLPIDFLQDKQTCPRHIDGCDGDNDIN